MSEQRLTGTDGSGRVYEWSGSEWLLQQEDPGAVGAGLISAGAEFKRLGRGAEDLASQIVDPFDQGARDQLAADQREDEELLAPLREARPISSTIGGIAPYVAAAPLAPNLPGAVALETVLGGLGLDPDGDRGENAAVAGALTLGGGAIAQRVIRGIGQARRGAQNRPALPPGQTSDSAGAARVEGSIVGTGGKISGVRSTLQNAGKEITGEGINSPADLDSLITLRQHGFNLKPGQQSGNRAARQLYQSAESNPLTSDITQEAIQNPNQQRFNREVIESLGDEAQIRAGVPEFQDGMIQRIKADIGEARKLIEETAPEIKLDDTVRNQIRSTVRKFTSDIGVLSAEDPVIRRIANVSERLEGGSIKSSELVKMRSSLKGLADTAKRPEEAQAFQDVAQALDDAFERSLKEGGHADMFKDFKLANQRFRLAEALSKPGVRSAEGDINAPALARNLEKIFKDEFGANKFGGLRESGEGGLQIEKLFNITKALRRFPDVAGRSGTAENLSLRGLFSDPAGTAGQLALRPVLRRIIEGQQVSVEELEQLRSLLLSQ